MTKREDRAVVSALKSGISSGIMGVRNIMYIKEMWRRVSPQYRVAIRAELKRKLPEYQLVITEAELHSLFNEGGVPMILDIEYQIAYQWTKLYWWMVYYQDPPDTKSSNSHLPVV